MSKITKKPFYNDSRDHEATFAIGRSEERALTWSVDLDLETLIKAASVYILTPVVRSRVRRCDGGAFETGGGSVLQWMDAVLPTEWSALLFTSTGTD